MKNVMKIMLVMACCLFSIFLTQDVKAATVENENANIGVSVVDKETNNKIVPTELEISIVESA